MKDRQMKEVRGCFGGRALLLQYFSCFLAAFLLLLCIISLNERGRPLWEREGGPCLPAFQGGQTLGLSRVGDTGSFGTWQHRWTPERSEVKVGLKVKVAFLYLSTKHDRQLNQNNNNDKV